MRDALGAAWREFLRFSPGPEHDVRLFFAPGRVNVIGEHIDYNGGRVFPAALTLGNYLFVRPRGDGWARFASTSFPGRPRAHMDHLVYDAADGFANYPKGVLWALAKRGVEFAGADFLFAGDLPDGAGLSSSASVELATAGAVNALACAGLTPLDLVLACQRAENDFVGVHSGIMDQYAVGMGRAGYAMLLDTATLQSEYVPLELGERRLMVINTNARRGLADSKYNERRAQCEQVLALLRTARPDLRHLAQVTAPEWDELRVLVADPVLQRRARHVITENERVNRAVAALRAGRLDLFGALLNASHASLRDDYEVTGPHLDALAEAAQQAPGCLGARMTGAGFGGCAVCVVKEADEADFTAFVGEAYERAVGLRATFYASGIGDGAHERTHELR